MTTAIQPAGGGGTAGGPSSSGLADVIDTILDKGLVIDAYVRLSLVGIELITIDARVVVASVDTYLRFAEAVNRLNISESDPKAGLPEIVDDVTSGAAKSKTQGVLDAAGEKLGDILNPDQPQRKKATRVRSQRGDR
jgi:gas vesicle structural protein